MSLVIFRHGQNRNHGDTTILTFLTACTFIQGCKVGVHVTRITTTARNLFTRCRYLTEGVSVVRNIGQDYKYVHVLLKCKILSSGKCHTRSCDTLYCRVVCKVDEHDGTVNRARCLETFDKVVGFLESDTHCSKYYCERFTGATYLCLTCNLCSQLSVRQTACGENRKLLSTNKGVQTVDCGDTCLDELLRIVSCCRIHRKTVDIHTLLRKDFRTVINRTSQTVEYTAQHILSNTKLHGTS